MITFGSCVFSVVSETKIPGLFSVPAFKSNSNYLRQVTAMLQLTLM